MTCLISENSKLITTIIESSSHAIETQARDGSMQPGHNGPWMHEETCTRNTSYWAYTYLVAHKFSGNKKFKNAAIKACEYLLSENARPLGDLFYCRKDKKMNSTNGLIGQAWVIETLLKVGDSYQQESLIDAAKSALNSISYNEKLNLWHTPYLSGKISSVSNTLNQQIYFTSVTLYAALLFQDNKLEAKCINLLNNLGSKIRYVEDIPQHKISTTNLKGYLYNPRILYADLTYKSAFWKRISLGYLSFIIYALALGKKLSSNHSIWDNKEINTLAIKSLISAEKILSVPTKDPSKFEWSYNPTGFEIAFGLMNFNNASKSIENIPTEWIDKQLHNHYCKKNKFMCLNTNDPLVLSARISELAQILDTDI